MLTIKCAGCKGKILKYLKIGKGKIHRCYKNRIQEYYVEFDGDKLKCPNCGTVLGTDEGDYIKMNHQAFTYSGTFH
ncbi:MAG: hypothetical protein ACOC35_03305 [Promethearchaeia archaeon]